MRRPMNDPSPSALPDEFARTDRPASPSAIRPYFSPSVARLLHSMNSRVHGLIDGSRAAHTYSVLSRGGNGHCVHAVDTTYDDRCHIMPAPSCKSKKLPSVAANALTRLRDGKELSLIMIHEVLIFCLQFSLSGNADASGPKPNHSHSIVAGGFDVMSYTTRLTFSTSFTMRTEILSSTSHGIRAQSAVMPSTDVTARMPTV